MHSLSDKCKVLKRESYRNRKQQIVNVCLKIMFRFLGEVKTWVFYRTHYQEMEKKKSFSSLVGEGKENVVKKLVISVGRNSYFGFKLRKIEKCLIMSVGKEKVNTGGIEKYRISNEIQGKEKKRKQ